MCKTVQLKRLLPLVSASLLIASSAAADETRIPLREGERLWGGNITNTHNMPYGPGVKVDLYGNNAGNQQQPLKSILL